MTLVFSIYGLLSEWLKLFELMSELNSNTYEIVCLTNTVYMLYSIYVVLEKKPVKITCSNIVVFCLLNTTPVTSYFVYSIYFHLVIVWRLLYIYAYL